MAKTNDENVFLNPPTGARKYIGLALMGMGGGLTGRDTIGTYVDAYSKAQDRAAQIAFEQEKFRQENDPEILKNKMIAQMNAYRLAMGQPPLDPLSLQNKTQNQALEQDGGIPDYLGIGKPQTTPMGFYGTPSLTGTLGAKSLKIGGMTLGQQGMGEVDKANLDILKNIKNKEQEKQLDVRESALTSQYNLDLSAQALADYSQLLAKSWSEGGAGNLIRGLGTQAAMEGVPIGGGDIYKSSGALSGKLVEIVSKTFPMLTQQIGKEGSVRLIESVFSKLGSSYPNAKTPPELAPEQISQSLLSMYRINRAMTKLNIQDFQLDKKQGRDAFVKRVIEGTKDIDFTPEEQEAFNALQNRVLAPINAALELRRRQKMKKGKK